MSYLFIIALCFNGIQYAAQIIDNNREVLSIDLDSQKGLFAEFCYRMASPCPGE